MPDKKAWTADDMPDLSGKTIVVTGGNSGIGYEAALQFARKRADVILACRDLGKARTAANWISASSPGAKVEMMELDLSNLASVRGFADAFHRGIPRCTCSATTPASWRSRTASRWTASRCNSAPITWGISR